MALLIESPLKLAWRSRRYKPLFSSDSVSITAIAIAERFARVLIISPVKPTLALASRISHKPNAIQWKECTERKTELVSAVSEFCRFRQSPLARAHGIRVPRPFVIIHDVNYYFGHEVSGRLNASSRADAEDTVRLAQNGTIWMAQTSRFKVEVWLKCERRFKDAERRRREAINALPVD